MSDAYAALLMFGTVSAIAVFVSLFFVTAPYGRHVRTGWGPAVPARVGWIVMESVSVFLFAYWCLTGKHGVTGAGIVLFAMWELHYVHRTFVWPFRMRGRGKVTPIVIVASAIAFNLFNAYINGRWVGEYSGGYSWDWISDPRFLIGAALFVTGAAINIHSDQILFSLRGSGNGGYRTPHGGLYRWVSCPNYLGEIIEWTGWAVAAWSPAGAVFAIWTVANLAPRAWANHRWNQANLPDYPRNRRALIPGLF